MERKRRHVDLPLLEDAMADTGLQEVETYVSHR